MATQARCPAVSRGDVGQVAAGARTTSTTSTTPPSLSLLLYDGGTSAAAPGRCIYHSTLGAKFAACTALSFDHGACRCILKCQESEDS